MGNWGYFTPISGVDPIVTSAFSITFPADRCYAAEVKGRHFSGAIARRWVDPVVEKTPRESTDRW